MPNINIETVGNALGQYCARYSNRIQQELKQSLEFEQVFNFVPCEHAYNGQEIKVNNLLQPYQKTFTPNNNQTHSGILNILEDGKIDLSFDWTEMKKFQDKWRANWWQPGTAESEWTYPRYIMDTVIMPQVIEDINLASWAGVRVEPTPGVASPFLETWDGFKKQIEDKITEGAIVPIATGAFTDATIIDQIRDFCKQLPLLYRKKMGTILMSPTNALMYSEAYQVKYPRREVNIKYQDKEYLRVDHFNKMIKEMNCMEGSNRIILTFKGLDSLIIGVRQNAPVYPSFRFFTEKRQLDIISEISRFYGFETVMHLFVNDQA